MHPISNTFPPPLFDFFPSPSSASFPLQLDSFRDFAKSKLSASAGEKLIRWPRSGEDRVAADRPSPPPQIN